MKCYIKDYPRPQFVRKDWLNLNGQWDFKFDDENKGEAEGWYVDLSATHEITVPFTYETEKSGICDETPHENVWYHKNIEIDLDANQDKRVIIHFEGSDFITKLWVNGQFAGSHKGAYARFSFDITNLVHNGENELTVKVEDSFDLQQPRGKQRWYNENFGCFYVQTTGIWKTVWLEYVPKISLSSVKMTPNFQDRSLDIDYVIDASKDCYFKGYMLETFVSFKGTPINRTLTEIKDDHFFAKVDMTSKNEPAYVQNIFEWYPWDPALYDVEFRILHDGEVIDEVGSYCAMREIRIDGPNVLLNCRPLYQRLLLDQGYWPESHLTPPSEEALIEDIDKVKAMGYNGVRKHQKTEDERFLYWCDVKGLLLWSEVGSAFEYSDYAIEEFTKEWLEIVKQNYNHPCIITWTPFNESWGLQHVKTSKSTQNFTEAVYHLTKAIDKHRPVVINDGWENTVSDILTIHDYNPSGEALKEKYLTFKDDILASKKYCMRALYADGYEYNGQPVIISEFGGIAFDNGDEGWGYGEKEKSEEAFVKRFEGLTEAIKSLPFVCGYCYTQVTDVQQEINGLMDAKRNFKVDPEIIKKINLK